MVNSKTFRTKLVFTLTAFIGLLTIITYVYYLTEKDTPELDSLVSRIGIDGILKDPGKEVDLKPEKVCYTQDQSKYYFYYGKVKFAVPKKYIEDKVIIKKLKKLKIKVTKNKETGEYSFYMLNRKMTEAQNH